MVDKLWIENSHDGGTPRERKPNDWLGGRLCTRVLRRAGWQKGPGKTGGPRQGLRIGIEFSGGIIMSIAKVTEIIATSNKSFDDAIRNGVKRADKTLKNIKGAWVKDQQVSISGGKITEYKVILKLTFVLKG
jgi:flavin-binding protein dodecin